MGTQASQSRASRDSLSPSYTNSSAFLLKAVYQRNMLFGLLVAIFVVTAPVLVVAYWPQPTKVVVSADPDDDDDAPDTIWIRSKIEDAFGIEYEQPKGPSAPAKPQAHGGINTEGTEINMVPDSIATADIDDVDITTGGGWDEGPIDEPTDIFEPVGGNVVIQEDTVVFHMGDELDRIPELVSMPHPAYPKMAQRVGAEGKVILHILVNKEGRVDSVVVFAESNSSMPFGEAAAAAAYKAHFTQALFMNEAVRCWVSLPVEFELQ